MKNFLKWALVIALPVLILTLMGPAALMALTDTHQHLMFAGATVGGSVPTLLDWAKRMGPEGKVQKIAELLSQSNEILEDMPMVQGNLPAGHRLTVRTSLPTVSWRLLNQGVAKSKSTTAQMDEQCGILEARSEVDVDLATLNDDLNAFRLSEATAFIEGMNEEMAQTMIYGNAGTAPEEFTGLALRYSATTLNTGQNIIKAGGSGSDNSSVYLVGWGPETVFGIFPKGSKVGLVHEDLGIGDAFDASNNRFRAYMDRWQWKFGLALKDWRYVVRICNIDISDLIADAAGSSVKLIEYFAKAIDRIPNRAMAQRLVFYAPRTVVSMLRLQSLNKSIANLGIEKAINQHGQSIEQLTFLGIPIKLLDQLLETEATVS